MSESTDLCRWTALELASAIRGRDVSSREVTEAVLERVSLLNPELNAVCVRADEHALERAKAADDAVARGDDLGPLHGVPYSLKDLTATAGIRTTRGSVLYADHVPTEDELVAERLAKRGGGVLIGKTNVPDHGCKGVTDNKLFGATSNPWDTSRTPGGSSGGAGAAVAVGMAPIAEGSDFAGSIRIPASFCGLVGLKPSDGRVPNVPNSALWHPVSSCNGPIARTVADAALLLQVMSGPDARDPQSLADGEHDFLAAATREQDLRGLSVCYSPDLGFVPVDREVRQVCAKALGTFADLGAEVVEEAVDFADSLAPYTLLNANLRAAYLADFYPQRRDDLDPLLELRVQIAGAATATDVARAELTQSVVYQRVHRLFERYDVIVTPTTPVVPFRLGVDYPPEIDGTAIANQFEQLGLTSVFNLTGNPAISIPAGWTAGGLPVGLQLIGPWRDDERVLTIAAAIERAAPWHDRWPPLVETAHRGARSDQH